MPATWSRARNRDADGDDSVLSVLDSLEYDQLWLMAVDTGDGLTPGDAAGIMRFRERGGGVLTARDHEDLGACLCCLGSIGQLNHFHSTNPATDSAPRRPGQPEHLVAQLSLRPERRLPARARGRTAARTPANVEEQQRTHRMLPRTSSRRCRVCAGRVLVRTSDPRGRSTVTGRTFNLAVVLDGEQTADGRPLGRAVASSTFHHFADMNWDVDCGAPSFVTEPPSDEIKRDPSRLEAFKDYVRNIARWLV